jgi:hypothetical protein
MIAFAGSAIASDDPNNPVSIPLPFAAATNVQSANPAGAGSPWEDCEESHHSVFYTFNSGSVTTIDFFAIGEDTEITVSPLADPGSDCLGGDEDAEPDFADVGLLEPTGWDSSQDISNSEWFRRQSITANTDYIVKVAFNNENGNESYDIAWGIAEAGSPTDSDYAASDDPNNPVSIPLPFAAATDVQSANPAGAGSPWEDCEESHHSVFYTFNSGSVTTIDFFAIGEDTEITVSPLADPGSDCLGGDEDADPDFADVGLLEPTGWDSSQDIGNSEWYEGESITANTEYIVKVAFNNENDNESYDIAWGIAEAGSPADYGSWLLEYTAADYGSWRYAEPTAVPTLPLYGLLLLGSMLGLVGFRKLQK